MMQPNISLASAPLELQYRFLLELHPKNVYELCLKGVAPLPCSSLVFWKEKYVKDFEGFRINLNVQSYKQRYLQIARAMNYADWFGYYSTDEIALNNVVDKLKKLVNIQLSFQRLHDPEAQFSIPSIKIGRNTSKGSIPRATVLSPKEFVVHRISEAEKGRGKPPNTVDPEFTEYALIRGQAFALDVLRIMGLNRLLVSIDVVYDLIFYLFEMSGVMGSASSFNNKFYGDFPNLPSSEEKSLLSSLSLRQLNNLAVQIGLFPSSEFENDHARLLFAIMIFSQPPSHPPLDQERLAYLTQFDTLKIYYLLVYYRKREFKKNHRGRPQKDPLEIPPYAYLALIEPDVELENRVMSVNKTSYLRPVDYEQAVASQMYHDTGFDL